MTDSKAHPEAGARIGAVSRLEARAVSASIDSEVLLAPVSFVVRPGTALAVRGPNGSGKTTLLRILSGQLRATSGEALLDGRPLDERERTVRSTISARIGFPAFARELTAHEQLRFIATTWGRIGSTATDAADATMQQLGILQLRNRFVNELSSGQTQLLAVATALVRPFDVLILDEPEQRLDEHRRALVAAAVRREIDRGASVVIASHSVELVDSIADATVTLGHE